MGKLIINYRVLRSEINKQLAGLGGVANMAFSEIKPQIDNIKNKTLEQFEDHPVTRELLMGPQASNLTNTLNNSRGNLFSFIGFNAGEDPTQGIRELLENTIDVSFVNKPKYIGAKVIRFAFPVSIPTMRDVEFVSPMPSWSSGSWAKRIEQSIYGIKRYLFSTDREFPQSRSGPAVQIKNAILKPTASFSRISYMTEILRSLNTRLFNKTQI